MVKHPNGTTTIYETTAPSAKKTIIQRKKINDPYTVQVVANNNTIILTPIGNPTHQSIQQQAQKSIVHIHRQPTTLMQPTNAPVQFLSTPQTFLKKQTIIHPQMTQKTQPKYTTVIRAPHVQMPPQQQIITTVSSKLQRPIQKQKVIMSTSSLQQYRSYNQKPGQSGAHGSRKQLHPQHIIRPAPTVIHHQMISEQATNQIPVILPTSGVSSCPTLIDGFLCMRFFISVRPNNHVFARVDPHRSTDSSYHRPARHQQYLRSAKAASTNFPAAATAFEPDECRHEHE